MYSFIDSVPFPRVRYVQLSVAACTILLLLKKKLQMLKKLSLNCDYIIGR